MLYSLSQWGMCYLEDLRSSYGHALVVLTNWYKSKIEVMQEQKTQVAHASMVQRAEHQIQMAEVLGSKLIGVTYCCWIFLSSHGKAFDGNFTIIANFVCLWKAGMMNKLRSVKDDSAVTPGCLA